MSIFSGASKGEKKQESDTWQNLSNLFAHSFGEGAEQERKGNENQDLAGGYYKGILAGDRTKLAPAVNAAVDTADAAKREQAQMGTARGGGVAGANQQIESHTRDLISSLLGEQQGGAADKMAVLGEGEIGQSMNALGIASGTEGNLSNILHKDVAEKNASAAKMWGSLISGGLNLATAGMSGGFSSLFGGSKMPGIGGSASPELG